MSDLAHSVVTAAAVGTVVTAAAEPMDDAINRVTGDRTMPPDADTKVVPVLSVGRKGYIGAAQVSGSSRLVERARAVLQLETEFDGGRYRIKLLSPVDSVNPFDVDRVRGVGITGLADIALSRGVYRAPTSGGIRGSDVLRGGAILVAVNEFGPQIDDFINAVARTSDMSPEGATKVVPYLSVGEKAYLGAMQVAGPSDQVSLVKAVWQYEDLFDRGRARLRLLVPSDSLNPLSIRRVKGVGCTAIIDTVAVRTREEAESYGYLRTTGLFVGDDRFAPKRRPPGWDRGRKVGWILHGDPYLPPGLSRKSAPPGFTIGAREGRERPRPEPGRARGRDREPARGPAQPPPKAPKARGKGPPDSQSDASWDRGRGKSAAGKGQGRGKSQGSKGGRGR